MRNKYKKIRISKTKTIDEHRLVMENLLGRKLRSNECVHHINGDTLDNRVENLEVISRSEHSRMHITDETITRLINSSRLCLSGAKLGAHDIPVVRNMYKDGHSMRVIADHFGVKYEAIRRIIRGRTWKHVK